MHQGSSESVRERGGREGGEGGDGGEGEAGAHRGSVALHGGHEVLLLGPLRDQGAAFRVDHDRCDDVNDRIGTAGAQPLACCRVP